MKLTDMLQRLRECSKYFQLKHFRFPSPATGCVTSEDTYNWMQLEVVVHLAEVVHLVFLQSDKPLETWGLFPGAVHAVDHVPLLLFAYEKNVEYFHLRENQKGIGFLYDLNSSPLGQVQPSPTSYLALAAVM